MADGPLRCWKPPNACLAWRSRLAESRSAVPPYKICCGFAFAKPLWRRQSGCPAQWGTRMADGPLRCWKPAECVFGVAQPSGGIAFRGSALQIMPA